LFAHQQAGIAPDFLCLSKGITGGYLPLSVVMTHDAIYQRFYDDDVTRGFLHSHSYTGSALAARAALATLDIFDEERVIETNRDKRRRICSASETIARHPRVRHFRNTGMIWAFEVAGADAGFSRRFFAAALERELLLRPLGSTVYFMPPYAIADGEIALLAARVAELLDAPGICQA
jgi:adenosylmethionine-8-amino-7-oxononanoate aminotransferase